MILNKDRRIAFIHIPKCGGTTLRNHFRKSNGWVEPQNIDAHANYSEYKEICEDYNIDTFICFLRDPCDWFLSFYKHSKVHGINKELVSCSFSDFIDNNINLYANHIFNQVPSEAIFFDLHDISEVIHSMGLGNIEGDNGTDKCNEGYHKKEMSRRNIKKIESFYSNRTYDVNRVYDVYTRELKVEKFSHLKEILRYLKII